MAEKLPEVVVVGDALLDEYHFVETSGTEQDAPVTRSARTEYAPGGAANVAANLTGLGIRTLLVAPLGDDDAGRRLDQLCIKADLPAAGTHVCRDCAGRPTPVKTRHIEQQTWRQLLRVDCEVSLENLTQGWEDHAITVVQEILDQRRRAEAKPVLVCSDYGKGACSHRLVDRLMIMARVDEIPVLVDTPRGGVESFRLYASPYTTFKLNVEQALRCGYGPWVSRQHAPSYRDGQDLEAKNHALFERLQAWMEVEDIEYRYLILTCGEHGMIMADYAPPQQCVSETGRVLEWCYPVGAGDTALAILAAFVARNGYTWQQMSTSLYMANVGAALAAAKPGTHRLLREELNASVGGEPLPDE